MAADGLSFGAPSAAAAATTGHRHDDQLDFGGYPLPPEVPPDPLGDAWRGPPGPQGPVGPQGAPGASASVFHYRADTHSQASNDPGAGYLRYNNATQSAATKLYIDRLTSNGFDATLMYRVSEIQDRFIIQDTDVSAIYQVWDLTGPAIDHVDWFEVPVSFVSQSGAAFSHNQAISVLIKSASAPGPQGPPGSAALTIGDTAPVSPTIGDMWFDSVGLQTYVWYNDGTSTQWVPLLALPASTPSDVLPLIEGTAAIGTSLAYARADHVHPTGGAGASTSMAFIYSGKPAASALANAPVVVPLTVPASLAGAAVYYTTKATSSAVFTLNRISSGATTGIGTFTIPASPATNTACTMAGSGGTLAAGDALQIVAPATPDATLADIGLTVLLTRL